MKYNFIQAEVIKLAITSLEYKFAVRVIAPVAMPTETYSVSVLDIIVTTTPLYEDNRILYEILYRKILTRYNQLIENQPLLDMIEDPDKFAPGTGVELEFVPFLMEWTGII